MFDPQVSQRRPCDKWCLDIDLKASQRLQRRESSLTRQPVVPWRRCSESPWAKVTCLYCLGGGNKSNNNNKKKRQKVFFSYVLKLSPMHNSRVFRRIDLFYPCHSFTVIYCCSFLWQVMINFHSWTAKTADSRMHGVAVALSDSIYFLNPTL